MQWSVTIETVGVTDGVCCTGPAYVNANNMYHIVGIGEKRPMNFKIYGPGKWKTSRREKREA